jgi:hypothetical protein
MARRSISPLVFDPFTLWWQLGLKTFEMLLASGQVIGMRVGRMATAGPNPSTRDRKEFTRMGAEKLEAAARSGLGMAVHMQKTWWDMWARLALAGLQPVHRTATANARRLGRVEARRFRHRK